MNRVRFKSSRNCRVDSYGESMCVAEWTGICRSFRCTGNISVCHRASDHSEYESEGRPYKKRRTDPAGSGECSDSDNETEILRMNRW